MNTTLDFTADCYDTGFITRQVTYVYRNFEARSCNDGCSRKAITITYSGCEFVAIGIQHAMRMLHTVTCGLSGSTVLLQIIT